MIIDASFPIETYLTERDRPRSRTQDADKMYPPVVGEKNINTFIADTVGKESRVTAIREIGNQEKSVKGLVEQNVRGLEHLKQERLGEFVVELMDTRPQTRDQLKHMIAENFSLGAHKEHALWFSWSELDNTPDMGALTELIRQELGLVIVKNAISNNLLVHSHKLDLL